ncbi:MAG: NAD(P)-dependent oxidoreductase [Betaproteobacteria bacterium]|nr:NAD(P)-dependent oxidoreductase [Betaproteobacteria bacterium]
MEIRNIGVASPGDMGQAIAARLKESGLNVYTALEGRSARTKALARDAGIEDCGSLEALVGTCEMVLSVLNPGAAADKAREVARAIRKTGRRIAFADCNAVSPQTVREIDGIIRDAGSVFIDAGIVGPPPRGKSGTRIYVSGPDAYLFTQFDNPSLMVRVVSERIGDASGVKMCYGAITKGAVALGVELLIAARRLGVEQALEAEFKESLADVYGWMTSRIPPMPPKAYRWVPEMLEIARTFEGVGMTPRIMQGAADMYEMVAATPLANESPEEARARARNGVEVVRALAGGK